MNVAPVITRIPSGAELTSEGGLRLRVRSGRGEGSYARVYQGIDVGTGRLCAVKLAKAEIPDAPERLEAERSMLVRLDHPQIVSLLDHGVFNGVPYLVLEWLEGETLLDLVAARRRLPLRRALEILGGVCEGLVHLHEHGVAHGDIRAQNVIVVTGRGAVLTDPGAQPAGTFSEDIRAAGGLFQLMLAGTARPGSGAALSVSAGHSRAAVELHARTQSAEPPTAVTLRDHVRRLQRSL